MPHNARLTAARAAFTDLLNALDDAREEISDEGEEAMDDIVMRAEDVCRRFDTAFLEQERES